MNQFDTLADEIHADLFPAVNKEKPARQPLLGLETYLGDRGFRLDIRIAFAGQYLA